jgi:hypothetical protein
MRLQTYDKNVESRAKWMRNVKNRKGAANAAVMRERAHVAAEATAPNDAPAEAELPGKGGKGAGRGAGVLGRGGAITAVRTLSAAAAPYTHEAHAAAAAQPSGAYTEAGAMYRFEEAAFANGVDVSGNGAASSVCAFACALTMRPPQKLGATAVIFEALVDTGADCLAWVSPEILAVTECVGGATQLSGVGGEAATGGQRRGWIAPGGWPMAADVVAHDISDLTTGVAVNIIGHKAARRALGARTDHDDGFMAITPIGQGIEWGERRAAIELDARGVATSVETSDSVGRTAVYERPRTSRGRCSASPRRPRRLRLPPSWSRQNRSRRNRPLARCCAFARTSDPRSTCSPHGTTWMQTSC